MLSGPPMEKPLYMMVESVEPRPNEMMGNAAASALFAGNQSIIVFTGEM